ncbi:MAG TPA: LLM class F420-dependent oxidoreductase, partial [Streptosporangiaceae bacterium]|nr:LLM class F420-dependent oxidoreductase [Streptosporangiaceae bacterium]
MSELPGPASFKAYAGLVRPGEITAQVPCGPGLGPYLKAAQAYADARFTHVAFVQIGAERPGGFSRSPEKNCCP